MSLKRFLLLFLFVFILAGCGGSDDNTDSGAGETAAEETAETPAADEGDEEFKLEKRIVVIGDSIAAGVGASTNFPSLIQSRTGISTVNAATPGISAEGGSSQVPRLIERFRPRFLVILLGTNNAAGAAGGVSGAINAIKFAVRAAQDKGVIPIVGTLPPISRDAGQNANASAISAGIRRISGARIARVDAVVSINDIADGLHPNDTGQAQIARVFAEQIQ